MAVEEEWRVLLSALANERPLGWFYRLSVRVLVVSCTPSIIRPVLPIAEFADGPSQVHTHAHTETDNSRREFRSQNGEVTGKLGDPSPLPVMTKQNCYWLYTLTDIRISAGKHKLTPLTAGSSRGAYRFTTCPSLLIRNCRGRQVLTQCACFWRQ